MASIPMRHCSQAVKSHFTSIALFHPFGARSDRVAGLSHLIDRCSLKPTNDKIAMQIRSISSRDYFGVQGTVLNENVRECIESITNAFSHVTEEQVRLERQGVQWEELQPELSIADSLHQAAYGVNSLGSPLFCPKDQLTRITADTINSHLASIPPDQFLWTSASEIPHGDLSEMITNTWSKYPLSASGSSPPPAITAAKYTGSSIYLPSQTPLAHIALAWPAVSLSSPLAYPLAILQSLLGGGSDFSAGGPGKGLYSRLYTEIVCRRWVDHCSAFQHMYTDTGLFGINVSFNPDITSSIPQYLIESLQPLIDLNHPRAPRQEEFDRARNLLKSRIAMQLESQQNITEDLAAQWLLTGKYETFDETVRQLDAITLQGLAEAARFVLLGNRMSVVQVGGPKIDIGRYFERAGMHTA